MGVFGSGTPASANPFSSSTDPKWVRRGILEINTETGESRLADPSRRAEAERQAQPGAVGPTMSRGERLLAKGASGVAAIPGMLGRSAEMIREGGKYVHPGIALADYVSDRTGSSDELRERTASLERSAQSLDPGLPEGVTSFMGHLKQDPIGAISETVVGALPATGIAAAMGPAAGAAFLASAEGGSLRDEALKRGQSEFKATSTAALAGTASFMLEKVGLDKIVGKTKGLAADEAMGVFMRAAQAMIPEAGTEAAQEFVNAAQEYVTGRDESMSPRELGDRLAQAAVGGAGAAAALGGTRPFWKSTAAYADSDRAKTRVREFTQRMGEKHGTDALPLTGVSRSYLDSDEAGDSALERFLTENGKVELDQEVFDIISSDLKNEVSAFDEEVRQELIDSSDPVIDNFLTEMFGTQEEKLGVKKTMGEKIEGFFREAKFQLENTDNPIIRIAAEAESMGREGALANMEYLTRRRRVVSQLVDSAYFDETKFEGRFGKQSLSGVLGGLSDQQAKSVIAVWSSRVGNDLVAKKMRGVENVDIDVSLKKKFDEATGYVQSLNPEEFAKYSEIADRLDDFSNRAIIAPLIDAGYLSADEVAQMSDEKGSVNFYEASKIAKGVYGIQDEGSLENPLQILIAQTASVARFHESQKIKNELGKIFDEYSDVFTDASRAGEVERKEQKKDGQMEVYEDGKKILYDINDKRLAESIEGVPYKARGFFWDFMRQAAAGVRAGATLVPGFMQANVVRDQSSAAVFSFPAKEGTDKNFFNVSRFGYVPVYDFFQGALIAAGVKDGNLRNAIISEGGSGSHLVSDDAGSGPKDILRAVLKGEGKQADLERFLQVWGEKAKSGPLGPVKAALHPLQAASNFVEASTRNGLYRRAILNGYTMQEAAAQYHEGTQDFSRKGKAVSVWNQIEAFASPAVGDVSKFARAIRDRPAATLAKAAAHVTLPSVALWLMNRDDEDYRNLHDWEKAAFYHLHKNEDGSWLRLPRPLGMLSLVFGRGVELALDAAVDKDPRVMAGVAEAVEKNTPLGYILNPMDAIPNAFQPAIEAKTDYNSFSDRPIEGHYMRSSKLPEDRHRESTPSVYKAAGRATGTSPLMLQHLWRGYTGSMGEAVARAVSAPMEERSKSRFVSWPAIGPSSAAVHELYEARNRLQQVVGSYQAARDAGDLERASEIAREYPEMSHDDLVNKGVRRMQEFREVLDKLKASDLPDDQLAEREAVIGRRMTREADSYLEAIGARAPKSELEKKASEQKALMNLWLRRNPSAGASQISEERKRLNQEWLDKYGPDSRYYPPVQ